jgi:hypothetical protein
VGGGVGGGRRTEPDHGTIRRVESRKVVDLDDRVADRPRTRACRMLIHSR